MLVVRKVYSCLACTKYDISCGLFLLSNASNCDVSSIQHTHGKSFDDEGFAVIPLYFGMYSLLHLPDHGCFRRNSRKSYWKLLSTWHARWSRPRCIHLRRFDVVQLQIHADGLQLCHTCFDLGTSYSVLSDNSRRVIYWWEDPCSWQLCLWWNPLNLVHEHPNPSQG